MRLENKKAYFNYDILEKLEAGIVLKGPEVKSLREGRGSIKESFARIENQEVFLHNFYIAPYPASFEKPDPLRKKKLLLDKREIKHLRRKLEEKGLTLIPLTVYFNKRGLVKVELALAKGKKLYDKREKIRERDVQRDIERRMKQG
ncbi:MAG: SsrA-binding protein SmpB [Candidatus Omnitrophica bacterium]|nr:SsrA-binding protein SmpB [Candidatus Omnitrophota bacterium]MCM8776738.1 SsrA-binding protein SmpB [Candidatus Omnitrophota bacterium]